MSGFIIEISLIIELENCRFGKNPTLSEEKSHVDGFMTTRNISSVWVKPVTIDHCSPRVSIFSVSLDNRDFAVSNRSNIKVRFTMSKLRRQFHQLCSSQNRFSWKFLFYKDYIFGFQYTFIWSLKIEEYFFNEHI